MYRPAGTFIPILYCAGLKPVVNMYRPAGTFLYLLFRGAYATIAIFVSP